ncbi:hypothetical protein T492DRAFT_1079372, partial [Pavlovales sp. CCMP2436]
MRTWLGHKGRDDYGFNDKFNPVVWCNATFLLVVGWVEQKVTLLFSSRTLPFSWTLPFSRTLPFIQTPPISLSLPYSLTLPCFQALSIGRWIQPICFILTHPPLF